MAIKAKFFVSEKRQLHNTDGGAVFLRPVYGDSDENKSWSKWTPSGQLEMQVTVQEVFDAFEIGAAYYLTFEGEPTDIRGIHLSVNNE